MTAAAPRTRRLSSGSSSTRPRSRWCSVSGSGPSPRCAVRASCSTNSGLPADRAISTSRRPSSGTLPRSGLDEGARVGPVEAGQRDPLDGPQPPELGQPRDDPVVGRRLRAVGEHDQDAFVGEVRGEEGQQVEGGPVGPLHVLDDVGHRAVGGQPPEQPQHRLEQPQPRAGRGRLVGLTRAATGRGRASAGSPAGPRPSRCCAGPGSGRRTGAAHRRRAPRRPRRPRRRPARGTPAPVGSCPRRARPPPRPPWGGRRRHAPARRATPPAGRRDPPAEPPRVRPWSIMRPLRAGVTRVSSPDRV